MAGDFPALGSTYGTHQTARGVQVEQAVRDTTPPRGAPNLMQNDNFQKKHQLKIYTIKTTEQEATRNKEVRTLKDSESAAHINPRSGSAHSTTHPQSVASPIKVRPIFNDY